MGPKLTGGLILGGLGGLALAMLMGGAPGGGLTGGGSANAANNVVRVLDYAACNWNGTTGTDDTTAIQAAITAAGAGGTVLFPAGKSCKITNSLVPLNYQTLTGNSTTNNALITNATIINAALGYGTAAISMAAQLGVTIQNLTIVGNPTYPTNAGGGIAIGAANTTRLINVQVDHCYWGFQASGANALDLIDVIITGSYTYGAFIYASSLVNIIGGKYSNSAGGGTSGFNLGINCHFGAGGTTGARGIYVHGALIDENGGGSDVLQVTGACEQVVLDSLIVWAPSAPGYTIEIGASNINGTPETGQPFGTIISNTRVEPFNWQGQGGQAPAGNILIDSTASNTVLINVTTVNAYQETGNTDITDNGVNTVFVNVNGKSKNTSEVSLSALSTAQIPAPAAPTFSTIATGGTLHSGTQYFFRVQALDGLGNATAAGTEASVTTGAGGNTYQILVNWASVAGAVQYQIGRSTTTNTETIIATVSGTDNQLDDTGAVAGAGSMSATNTTGLIKGGAGIQPASIAFASLPSCVAGLAGDRYWDSTNTSDVVCNGTTWNDVAGSVPTSTGSWNATFIGLVTTGSNFGAYTPTVVTNGLKFRDVTCDTVTTAGVGAAGTLIIKDVTGASTLCTPANGNFNCAAVTGTPFLAGDCNTQPTAGHIYSVEISGCTSFPTGEVCSIDIVSP